jgi:molecular chaperone Hsp33
MKFHDQLQRFLFSGKNIRGIFVNLQKSFTTIMQQHGYSLPIQAYLAELLTANTLLAANLKFQGTLTIQLDSQGTIEMLVSKCDDNLGIRGLAKYASDVPDEQLQTDFSNGKLVVTVTAHDQSHPYQSIVALQGNSMAQAIQSYFQQSEQLRTRLYLASDASHATGLLLQQLPSNHPDLDYWQHITCLTDTLQAAELLELNPDLLFKRFYHQEELEIFPAQAVSFACNCSLERTRDSVRVLGKEEAYATLNNKKQLYVTCDFCNQSYTFDQQDLDDLFITH